MENQLNYYSRYNRRKIEEKKQIPSLYSLLSLQTLTKLAHDATVSLQMISLYKKEKAYRSMVGDQQTEQSQYLQANNLFTFRSSESQSVDRKKNPNRKNKSQLHVMKKKTKLNQVEQQQKVSKQAYLQNLVQQVRSKSIQRLQTNSLPKQSIKRQKKKKKITSSKSNTQQQTLLFQTLNNSHHLTYLNNNNNQVQNKQPQSQSIGNIIHRKLIKSLVTEQVQSIKQSCQKQRTQHRNKQIRKQYVQSIDDGNQKQMSGPSIVLERMNFKVQPLKYKAQQKQRIEQRIENKVLCDVESKQDNPSVNDGKSSQIKSFSKKLQQLKKPFKNLISIQLTHSQSQIWKPEQRSLQIPHQFQQENILLHLTNQNQSIENQIINFEQIKQNNHHLIQNSNKQKIKINQMIQIFSGIHQVMTKQEEIKTNFHSQINQLKLIQDPPYQHPLETLNYQNHVLKPQIVEQDILFTLPTKKPFKKFIFNKQLNPRLVTSTILNQRNQMNFNSQRDKLLKHQGDENKNQKLDSSIQIVQEKSEKVNFKALMKKKKEIAKQENLLAEKTEKQIPLRKLQNRKLLQAFFNNN